MAGLDHFGLLAPWYDRIIPYHYDDELVSWAELPISGNLLDIGGGTGRVAGALVNLAGNLEIVDVSFKMVRIAKNKGLSASCAYGEAMPYPDGTFTRILIVDALHHCVDQQGVIKDIWRVLKPGGILIIIEPNYAHVAGKLIRVFEKLILMGSKFLSDQAIISLFQNYSDEINIKHVKGNSWFKIKKI